MNLRAPDWPEWMAKEKWKLWEGLALLCGICPDHIWSEFSALQAAKISKELSKNNLNIFVGFVNLDPWKT